MQDSEFLKKAIPAIREGKSAKEIANLTQMDEGKSVSARLTKLRKKLKPEGVEIPRLRQGRKTEDVKELAEIVRSLQS